MFGFGRKTTQPTNNEHRSLIKHLTKLVGTVSTEILAAEINRLANNNGHKHFNAGRHWATTALKCGSYAAFGSALGIEMSLAMATYHHFRNAG